MNIISIISFIIIISIILYSIFKKTDILSPGKLFIIIWALAIGLTELKLSRLQYEWSTLSWIYLLIPIASVLTGIFTIYVLFFDKKVYSLQSIRNIVLNSPINEKKLIGIIISLFVVYIASYFIIYLYIGFIPIFTKYPNEARTKWSIFGIGLLVHLAPIILYLIIVYILLIKRSLIRKILLTVIAAATFITFLFILQRFGIFITIVLTIVLIYYGTKKFNYKTVLFLLLIIFGLSYLILSLRAGSLILQYFHYVSQMKYSPRYSIFTEPYMYVVMNLENYSYATTKLNEFTYGLASFDFLFAVTGLKHWLHEYINFNEKPFLLNYNYNTYSMFFVNFRDFYVFGIFILPYLFGMLVSFLYYKMKKNPNINTISIYGIFVITILFSFFNPTLSWLFYVFDIIVLYLSTSLIIKNCKE